MTSLIIFILFVSFIALIFWAVTTDYDKCYTDRELYGYAVMNCCSGEIGGTKETNYLSEKCIECPYLVIECSNTKK